MKNNVLIELKEVSKKYQLGDTEINALDKVNYIVNKGDYIVVAGPSGSGKSTLLNMIGCIDQPTIGEIFFDKIEITKHNLEDLNNLRLLNIGFIFQSFNLIPVLSVYENVELPLLFRNMCKRKIRERVEYVLKKVGLGDRGKHFPSNLSGGQRQRVAIARALVGEPNLIIADEPTANLDRITAQNIIELLKALNKDDNVTIIIASHDDNVIRQTSQVITIEDGKIKN